MIDETKGFLGVIVAIVIAILIYIIFLKNNNIKLDEISIESEIEKINSELLKSSYLDYSISMENCEYDNTQNVYYYPLKENLDIYIKIDQNRNVRSVGVSYKNGLIENKEVEDLYGIILVANNKNILIKDIEKILNHMNDEINKKDIDQNNYKTDEIEVKGLRCNKTISKSGYSFYIIERIIK